MNIGKRLNNAKFTQQIQNLFFCESKVPFESLWRFAFHVKFDLETVKSLSLLWLLFSQVFWIFNIQLLKYSAGDISTFNVIIMLPGSCRKIRRWGQWNTYHTIRFDEVIDCSMKEQIILVSWFVGKNGTIREKFVSFLECSCGLSGHYSKQLRNY